MGWFVESQYLINTDDKAAIQLLEQFFPSVPFTLTGGSIDEQYVWGGQLSNYIDQNFDSDTKVMLEAIAPSVLTINQAMPAFKAEHLRATASDKKKLTDLVDSIKSYISARKSNGQEKRIFCESSLTNLSGNDAWIALALANTSDDIMFAYEIKASQCIYFKLSDGFNNSHALLFYGEGQARVEDYQGWGFDLIKGFSAAPHATIGVDDTAKNAFKMWVENNREGPVLASNFPAHYLSDPFHMSEEGVAAFCQSQIQSGALFTRLRELQAEQAAGLFNALETEPSEGPSSKHKARP